MYDPFAAQSEAAYNAEQMRMMQLQQQQMLAQQQQMQRSMNQNNGYGSMPPAYRQGAHGAGAMQNTAGQMPMRPTGGQLAKKMGMNSPYFVNGRFRKPTQQDMIEEIAASIDLLNRADVVRIEDEPLTTRHVCTTKPYFHPLTQHEYPVSLPDYDIVVRFYFHLPCARLIVCSSTLSQ